MKVTKIQTVLSEIQNVIFSSQGQGFTVELDPEITKCYEYEPKFNLLSKEPYSWRHRWWDEGTLSQQELLSVHSGWGYSLPQDIVNMLPLGVSLKKTEIQVLLDTRKGKPTRNTLHNAKYAEGRRVYLMVTDEYAQQVFKNTYSNVGHIFRDHLLNEQSVLLKKIVNDYIHVTEHNGIERCFLGITPQGITTCSWFSFSSDDDWSNYIKFEHMGKLDLKNVGEQYGFLLALKQTIENTYPQLKNSRLKLTSKRMCYYLNLENSFDYITIEIETDRNPKTLTKW